MDEGKFGALLCLMTIVLSFIGGAIVGWAASSNVWRHHAVNNGSAQWTVDPKTGETEFVWLKCEREPTPPEPQP